MTIQSPDSLDPEILNSFRATGEFILYALTRADWMGEYFSSVFGKEDPLFKVPKPVDNKPALVLIEGGKED